MPDEEMAKDEVTVILVVTILANSHEDVLQAVERLKQGQEVVSIEVYRTEDKRP